MSLPPTPSAVIPLLSWGARQFCRRKLESRLTSLHAAVQLWSFQLNGQTWTPGQAAAPGTITRGPSDANGNLLAPPGGSGGTYTWDVENRLVSSTAIPSPQPLAWGYDPWGKRISECCRSLYPKIQSLYFYGISGKRLATYQVHWNDDGTYSMSTSTNLYFAGTLIV